MALCGRGDLSTAYGVSGSIVAHSDMFNRRQIHGSSAIDARAFSAQKSTGSIEALATVELCSRIARSAQPHGMLRIFFMPRRTGRRNGKS